MRERRNSSSGKKAEEGFTLEREGERERERERKKNVETKGRKNILTKTRAAAACSLSLSLSLSLSYLVAHLYLSIYRSSSEGADWENEAAPKRPGKKSRNSIVFFAAAAAAAAPAAPSAAAAASGPAVPAVPATAAKRRPHPHPLERSSLLLGL